MLTRVFLPRRIAVSVGRLFATSVPHWNVKGTATTPLDADAIKAQIAQLKTARKERLFAKRKEVRAQNLVREEQNEAKKLAAIQARLAKRKEIRAQLRLRAIARKEQGATESAERVAMIFARRALKQSRLAKWKEICAQLRARAVFRKEQAAARAATERAKATESAKTAAAVEKVKTTSKLPSAFNVYTAEQWRLHGEQMASALQPGEKITVAFARVSVQYKALTAEQRLPYEQKAAANLKLREAASAKNQGLCMSAFTLFVKTNFKVTAESIPDAPIVEGAVVDRKALAIAKMSLIMRALAVKWKALSPGERAAYKAKADVIRAEAQKNLAEMVAETKQEPRVLKGARVVSNVSKNGVVVDRKALTFGKSQKGIKALAVNWKEVSPASKAKIDASRAEIAMSVFKTA